MSYIFSLCNNKRRVKVLVLVPICCPDKELYPAFTSFLSHSRFLIIGQTSELHWFFFFFLENSWVKEVDWLPALSFLKGKWNSKISGNPFIAQIFVVL